MGSRPSISSAARARASAPFAEPEALAGGRTGWLALRLPLAELWPLLVLTGTLNLWDLGRNRWANIYYSAAVRSMSASWHDFLFASLDRTGVMTVDKPPLALWVQALSVRVFGYHPLSVLVPQALMGVASVALLYDLVRIRFGRVGGFIAGLALALTPMTVAISRHNNPDALLVLCSIAALWCAARALERGSGRWLAAAGVCVGLGFETKMGVALVVLPGIVAAWLWVAPAARGRLHALRQLLAAGAAMVIVGGAWPLLVELTPAADRPWISGTSDNSILSLIFEYNGLGRVDGQAGGPGGGGGNAFGGSTGPARLLNSALGGQAGWLLGFALIATLAILISTRLRRSDERTGWLIAVGAAFLATAVLFSFASGIFHPYYVSLLAPFLAALVGAGAASLLAGTVRVRIFGPLMILAGAAVELVIRADYQGQLDWLVPVLIAVALAATLALLLVRSRRMRLVAVAGALAALLLAPAVWALDTLGYATSSTFPSGGPEAIASLDGPGGAGGAPRGFRVVLPGARSQQLFGVPGAGAAPAGGEAQVAPTPFGAQGALGPQGSSGSGGAGGGIGASPFGGGAGSLKGVLAYIDAHGGGPLAVSSQSTAAGAIIEADADVAGIGGFSGRESDVSLRWLAQEVRAGKVRWVLDEEGQLGSGPGAAASGALATGLFGAGSSAAPGLSGPQGIGATGGQGPQASAGAPALPSAGPGERGGAGAPRRETRLGSKPAMAAVARACRSVSLSSSSASAGALYDCRGRASALESS